MLSLSINEFTAKASNEGKLLALDIGEKRIGIALSDIEQILALPLEVYTRINIRKDIGYINRLCKEHKVVGLIIGLPISLDNTEGENCQKVRQFADKIYDKTKLPILLIDERMSTAAVTRLMKDNGADRKTRHDNDDKLAASYLLQIVIDSKMPSV